MTDKKFEKLGFKKVKDDEYAVEYERKKRLYGYTQVIALCHKKSGRHIIQSYQKDVNRDGFNNMVGLTSEEAKLCIEKMKQKGWV